MTALPPDLKLAVEVEIAGRGGLKPAAAALTGAYRAGATSQAVDLSAYLATRLPATFAAAVAVLAEVRRLMPDLSPRCLIDAGSGPGTASWAAAGLWPGLAEVTFIDHDESFLALAGRLSAAAGHAALRNAAKRCAGLHDAARMPPADLVVASYALAEIRPDGQGPAVAALWQAGETLVLIEPGTPAGFTRLRAARTQLLALGARLIGPCPHDRPCPIDGDGWCHFRVRLPRSRTHLHAKGGSVPFEDENFSWLAATRRQAPTYEARLIGSPRVNKVEAILPLCTAGGLEQRHIARRDKQSYAAARKLDWGDAL